MNPKKQKVTEAIKTLGYNSRQVSVKEGGGSLETSFNVTVRDPKVNMEAVEQAVSQHESIDRCQFSGEILGGGNTFIFVKATEEVKEAWVAEFMPAVEKAASNVKAGHGAYVNENYLLSKNHNGNGYRISYYKDKNYGENIGYENTITLRQVAYCIAVHGQKIQIKKAA